MKRKINKNFVLIALSLVLILESVILVSWAGRLKKEQGPAPVMATLSLEPKEGSVNVGQELEVKVLLDTGDYQTDATDIRLTFNPQVLTVTKITQGEIYDSYPAKKVDQEKGLIVVNGITSVDKIYKGKDIFAKIVFKGIKKGKSELIFEFTPEATSDSNVVATRIAKDILGGVEGASMEIN